MSDKPTNPFLGIVVGGAIVFGGIYIMSTMSYNPSGTNSVEMWLHVIGGGAVTILGALVTIVSAGQILLIFFKVWQICLYGGILLTFLIAPGWDQGYSLGRAIGLGVSILLVIIGGILRLLSR